MKITLITLVFILLAGCYRQGDNEVLYSQDLVWTSYRFEGPMPRAYEWTMLSGLQSTGKDVTNTDIQNAPCKVVLGRYKSSCYKHSENTIYLDIRAKASVFWHESQHCRDMNAGMQDRKELERRAMIAEMGGIP